MLKDDVLMRQIRQMIEGLLRAAGLRREKQEHEALQTLDELISELMSVGPEVIDRLAVSSLLDMLSPAGELDAGRTGALALLLEEKARVLRALADDDEADLAAAKAAALLAAAEAAGFDREAALAAT